MSPQVFAAGVCVCVGVGLVLAGLVWLFGPYGLLGSGVVMVAAGLLLPVKERRGEPAEHPASPD